MNYEFAKIGDPPLRHDSTPRNELLSNQRGRETTRLLVSLVWEPGRIANLASRIHRAKLGLQLPCEQLQVGGGPQV